ncbi:MAG: heparinase II/III family protein [Saprospiraceae bacterium]
MNISKLINTIKIIPKLGFWNVAYTVWYKISLKLGWRKRWFNQKPTIQGVFYTPTSISKDYREEWKDGLTLQVDKIMSGIFTWFSYHHFEVGAIPNWHYNPFDNVSLEGDKHWSEINDFGLKTGDIKIIWELSRFDWLTTLSRAYKVFGNKEYLTRINQLLNDWSKNNPLNTGPNWKCGQETSIRVMKLLTSAQLLDQFSNPQSNLLEIVFQHLERIEPNINYAIAQDNNHGTSEASVLYIGATWLLEHNYKSNKLKSWKKQGRTIIENRIQKLIQPQGTFSQRSMTYHRVMVDTMIFTLQMMKMLKEPTFNNRITKKIESLAIWQYKMTFGANGDAPNFGSNDGALFENLHSRDYRDFRSSTQTIFGTIFQKLAYNNLDVSEVLYWRLGKDSLKWKVKEIDLPKSEVLDNQMVILRKENIIVFLKNPEDTFRPGNDSFHIDLWYKGECILQDSGTYSYNAGTISDGFKSVAAHNTIQFGNYEQMPKISRFLNGAWIKSNPKNGFIKDDDSIIWQGSYKDYEGNKHTRNIFLSENTCSIKDEIQSNKKSVIKYHINESNTYHIENIKDYKVSKTEISKYYLQKENATLLEKTINKKSTFTIKFTI